MSGGYQLVGLSSEYSKHLASISSNIVNTNQNSLSIQSIDFINYYSEFFKLVHKTFYPLFYNLIYFNLSDLDSYITSIISTYKCMLSEVDKLETTLIPAAKNTYESIKCCIKKLKCSVCWYANRLKDLKCAIKKIEIHATIPSPLIKEITAKLTVKYKINMAELKKSIQSCLCKIQSTKFEYTKLDDISSKISCLKCCICSDIKLLCCLKWNLGKFNMFDENASTLTRFILGIIPRLESWSRDIIVKFNKDIEEKCKELKKIESELGELEKCVQTKLDSLNKTILTGISIGGLKMTQVIDVECNPPKLTEDLFYKKYKSSLSKEDIHLKNIKSDLDNLKFDDNIQKIKKGASSISELLFKRYLRCSLQSASAHLNHNIITNWDRQTGNIGGLNINNVLMSVMSTIVIDESIFAMSKIYVYYKTKNLIDQTLQIFEYCQCIEIYNKYFDKRPTGLTLLDPTHVNDNPYLNSYSNNKKINEGNHLCPCMVVRYILLNDLYLVLRYNDYLYMDMLSCMSRNYNKYSYLMVYSSNSSKLIMLIVTTLDKLIRWMKNKLVKYNECFCYVVDNSYYTYLIYIILSVSSLIENIWIMDPENIIVSIEKISSLLSEYQSLHVYTNYYSPSLYNALRNIISGLTSGKSTEVSGSHSIFAMGVGVKDKGSLVCSGMTNITTITESKENSETTSTSVISTGSLALLNESTKSGFMSLRTMILGTHFSKERFTLIYNRFSFLSYIFQSKIKDGTLDVRNMYVNIALKYLDELCKQPYKQTCCQKNGVCRICPVAKIKINCLSISFKEMGLIIANVSGDMLLNYLMGSISITEDFITNLCVGFGEVYTIMLKNNLLTHPNHDIGVNPLNTVKSRNWGYDTLYEHVVTTLSNHKLCPKLLTVNRGTIDKIQNIDTHLPLVPT